MYVLYIKYLTRVRRVQYFESQATSYCRVAEARALVLDLSENLRWNGRVETLAVKAASTIIG